MGGKCPVRASVVEKLSGHQTPAAFTIITLKSRGKRKRGHWTECVKKNLNDVGKKGGFLLEINGVTGNYIGSIHEKGNQAKNQKSATQNGSGKKPLSRHPRWRTETHKRKGRKMHQAVKSTVRESAPTIGIGQRGMPLPSIGW